MPCHTESPTKPGARPARDHRIVSLRDPLSVRAPAQERRFPLPRVRLDESSRQASPIWLPVALGASIGLGFAIWSFASGEYGWRELAGIVVLLAAASVAEAFPVPIEGVAVGATSLATIFLVAIAAVYGWAAAAVAGSLAMAFVEVARRRPFSRIAFNCGVYVIGGIAAGAAAATIDGGTLFHLVVGATAAAVCFYLVDITLLTAVVSRSRGMRFVSSLRNYVRLTLTPFAIMASLTVILVVLWDRSPYVAVVLAGPLLATALYQRWIHGALDRLREFDRLKDEFIAIVSHELRTPLTSVYGAAVTLRKHELDDTRRNQLLDIVSTESARLGRLLDDILWVSRLDSGRAQTFITRVEPLELVSDVVDATRTHLPPGLSLEYRHDSASQPVAADPDRLRQVLVNLMENAVKYSGEGRIEVRVQPQYGTTRFTVRDEGRGIPVDEVERIFEKFYRLDPNMTEGVGGTGLGLYICRELIEGMRGQIWANSELGKGSTFIFELPVFAQR
jgi:signal transduction histidine kinase